MDWKSEWKAIAAVAALFAGVYWLPVGTGRFDAAMLEALYLARWYAREHVLLCLVPALFIAGAISVFVSHGSVMKYLGPKANRTLAYGVASVSGTVLAVCSCTVLPLFAGIYRMGAGIGPASAFLYAGPAINVLAIVLTGRVLGLRMGVARALGAIAFGIVIGLIMRRLFRDDEARRLDAFKSAPPASARPLWQTAAFFGSMIAILVFANAASPFKWPLTTVAAALLAFILVAWLKIAWWRVLAVAAPTLILAAVNPVLAFGAAALGLAVAAGSQEGEPAEWVAATWALARQILPLLLIGILLAGALLGRPGHEGLIPSSWVVAAVGGNSLGANLFAAVAGAFMYFATLTEIPILQGLMASGMGPGPGLALLLAGPALSLPSILVLRSIMGARKTLAYLALVVTMAAAAGMIYGEIVA